MATYLILNLCFIAAIVVVLRLLPPKPSRACWFTLAILLILTAVFDSVIISAGIVGYDTDKLLSLYVGAAPVEDFFYALLAALLIPALWNKLGGTHAK